jgi:hypothetical protein
LHVRAGTLADNAISAPVPRPHKQHSIAKPQRCQNVTTLHSVCIDIVIITELNIKWGFTRWQWYYDRLCGLAIRVLGYRSGGPGSIPDTTIKIKAVGLERGALSLVSTTEELFDRKVAAPV